MRAIPTIPKQNRNFKLEKREIEYYILFFTCDIKHCNYQSLNSTTQLFSCIIRIQYT